MAEFGKRIRRFRRFIQTFLDKTDLKKIESHCLQELIYQDLSVYPESQIGDIHTPIEKEIAQRKQKAESDKMVENGKLAKSC